MNDATLVSASLCGDRNAFGGIVERYQSMACAVAFSIVGELAASEDAAQEAFIIAWQQLGTLREPNRLRPWLAGVVRNTAKSSLRKRQHDLVRNAGPVESVPTTARSPDDVAAHHEEETLLGRALAEVPEQFREPLVLYYRERQSIAEVAMTMEISEDAVKQRLARGRQALKDQVATYVESALKRTGPTAAFTAGVLATLNSTAGAASAATVAAGGAAATSGAMATGAAMGVVGGIGGGLLGIAGGVFGTVCSIRGTRTPAERAFMIKVAWVTWISVLAVTAAYLYICFCQRSWFESAWFQVAYWASYSVMLCTAIFMINRKAARLRRQDTISEPSEVRT